MALQMFGVCECACVCFCPVSEMTCGLAGCIQHIMFLLFCPHVLCLCDRLDEVEDEHVCPQIL